MPDNAPALTRAPGWNSGAGRKRVANAVSIVGAAMLFGRTGTGYFLDRFFAPRVCATLVSAPLA